VSDGAARWHTKSFTCPYNPTTLSLQSWRAGKWRCATQLRETEFLRALEKNHRILTPTGNNWLESGRLLGQIYADRAFAPDKLRDLHFDILIALTARSYGARLITSDRADFEMINTYRRFQLETW